MGLLTVALISLFFAMNAWKCDKWVTAFCCLLFAAISAYGVFYQYGKEHVLKVAVPSKYKDRLGVPEQWSKTVAAEAYEGEYDNAIVLWVDQDFFQLSLIDDRSWSEIREHKASLPKHRSIGYLKEALPECSNAVPNTLPWAGVAQAMQYDRTRHQKLWDWIGCGVAHAIITSEVRIQRFANGYVIEGAMASPTDDASQSYFLVYGEPWVALPVGTRTKYRQPGWTP